MVITVELYEHEVWRARTGWAADAAEGASWWRSREGAAAASTRETFAAPRGYAWSGDWALSGAAGRNGEALVDGWEYATRADRFEGRPPRGPRGVDWYRRRQWARPARPAARRRSGRKSGVGAPSSRAELSLARVQAGLDTVRQARRKLGEMARHCGTDLDGAALRDALDDLGVGVKKGALEVTAALDSASDAVDAGTLKKLRRDLHREVDEAADVLRRLPAEPDEWPSAEDEERDFSKKNAPAPSPGGGKRRGSAMPHVVEHARPRGPFASFNFFS